MSSQIHTAMCEIMKEIKGIGKNQKNVQQNFKYRGIDDVYNAIQPVMAEHGVFCTLHDVKKTDRQERPSRNGGVLAFVTLHLCYRFYASDGSFVETQVIGEGMDSGDKASNKAMAVGHKYAILQTFCIPTEDMPDPDAECHTPEPRQQQDKAQPKQEPKTSLSDRAQALASALSECTDTEQIKEIWNRQATLDTVNDLFKARRESGDKMVAHYEDCMAKVNPFQQKEAAA